MDGNYVCGVKLKKPLPPESYLRNLPAVRHLAEHGGLGFEKPVTFLVGENGTGKSTLLEAIAAACGFNPEGGTRNFTFSTRATHSELYRYLTVVKKAHPRDGFFLRAESFYNGESFLALIRNRFGGNGLYLLDEPEAALSPSRLMSLLVRMHELAEEHSQFITATHSPILMAYPGAEVYELSESGIRSVDYRETEHYRLTLRFLENPEKMLRYLLKDK